MANRILFQESPPSDFSAVTVWTVPLLKERIISSLVVSCLVDINDTQTPEVVKYKLHIVADGDSPTAKNCIGYFPLFTKDKLIHEYNGIRLMAWDSIVIYSLEWRISIQAFGEQANDWINLKYEDALDALVNINTHLASLAASQVARNTATKNCICP